MNNIGDTLVPEQVKYDWLSKAIFFFLLLNSTHLQNKIIFFCYLEYICNNIYIYVYIYILFVLKFEKYTYIYFFI